METHDLHLHHLQLQLRLRLHFDGGGICHHTTLGGQLALHEQILLLLRKTATMRVDGRCAWVVIVNKVGVTHHVGQVVYFLFFGKEVVVWCERCAGDARDVEGTTGGCSVGDRYGTDTSSAEIGEKGCTRVWLSSSHCRMQVVLVTN
jgi:hypothetical protein